MVCFDKHCPVTLGKDGCYRLDCPVNVQRCVHVLVFLLLNALLPPSICLLTDGTRRRRAAEVMERPQFSHHQLVKTISLVPELK